MSYDYDPLKALRDEELVNLVREAAEPCFDRRQKEWLEELIRRLNNVVEEIDGLRSWDY